MDHIYTTMNEPITIIHQSEKIIIKIAGSLTDDRLGLLKKNITDGEALIKHASEKQGKKINILLDLTEFDGTYDMGAMELMVQFGKNNRHFIEKTAVFGGSAKANLIGKSTAALTGRENIKFFTTQAEAESWLER